jgi:hypothetical protein
VALTAPTSGSSTERCTESAISAPASTAELSRTTKLVGKHSSHQTYLRLHSVHKARCTQGVPTWAPTPCLGIAAPPPNTKHHLAALCSDRHGWAVTVHRGARTVTLDFTPSTYPQKCASGRIGARIERTLMKRGSLAAPITQRTAAEY